MIVRTGRQVSDDDDGSYDDDGDDHLYVGALEGDEDAEGGEGEADVVEDGAHHPRPGALGQAHQHKVTH